MARNNLPWFTDNTVHKVAWKMVNIHALILLSNTLRCYDLNSLAPCLNTEELCISTLKMIHVSYLCSKPLDTSSTKTYLMRIPFIPVLNQVGIVSPHSSYLLLAFIVF